MSREVCVVSSGRADYGLLFYPMREIQKCLDLSLQTVVTGMHLSKEYGSTVDRFLRDGFPVTKEVKLGSLGGTSREITMSLGLAVVGFADAFSELQPDIVLLLGDRFEILAAAQAALIARIPIAHIGGGDTTEGAFDEAIRHSITKMSHLHFTTNHLSARRVLQMGENPENVYMVGSTGLDAIRKVEYLDRTAFFNAIKFYPRNKNLLITFHPATLGSDPALDEFQELLAALDILGDEFGLIFTIPNADTEGALLMVMLDKFVESHCNAKVYAALGDLYLSGLKNVDVVVGNSSSGLYEAPSFGIGTVNIGDRQKGRLQATSIINCKSSRGEIVIAIREALAGDFSATRNPYGDGHTSEKIVGAINSVPNFRLLLQKHFFMSGEI